MTTADSCKEFNALGASIGDPGSMTADARAKVAGKFADLAGKSSDALKDDIQVAADFIKASTTGAPDAEVAQAVLGVHFSGKADPVSLQHRPLGVIPTDVMNNVA